MRASPSVLLLAGCVLAACRTETPPPTGPVEIRVEAARVTVDAREITLAGDAWAPLALGFEAAMRPLRVVLSPHAPYGLLARALAGLGDGAQATLVLPDGTERLLRVAPAARAAAGGTCGARPRFVAVALFDGPHRGQPGVAVLPSGDTFLIASTGGVLADIPADEIAAKLDRVRMHMPDGALFAAGAADAPAVRVLNTVLGSKFRRVLAIPTCVTGGPAEAATWRGGAEFPGREPASAARGTVEGAAVPRDELRRVVMPVAQRCYEARLKQDPSFAARVVVGLGVTGLGALEEVRLVSTDRPDVALESCLSTNLAGLVVPGAGGGERVEVELPLSFSPRR